MLRTQGQLLLLCDGLMIGIKQLKLVQLVKPKAEGNLPLGAQTRKILEDLFERCLADTILLNIHFLLLCFDETEQEANGLVFSSDA